MENLRPLDRGDGATHPPEEILHRHPSLISHPRRSEDEVAGAQAPSFGITRSDSLEETRNFVRPRDISRYFSSSICHSFSVFSMGYVPPPLMPDHQ